MVLNEDTREIKMPPLRQFERMDINRDQKMSEEAKKQPAAVHVVREADNVPVIRDLQDKDADLDLVQKLLKAKDPRNKAVLELRYDDRYLREVFKGFANKIMPITNMKFRDTFDHYAFAFRKYTEEKLYSGIKNLPNFIQSLSDFEGSMKLEYKHQGGAAIYWQEAHESLGSVWDLLKHHLVNIDPNSFTEEDLVLYSENFQKALSKSTANYLEKDFAK